MVLTRAAAKAAQEPSKTKGDEATQKHSKRRTVKKTEASTAPLTDPPARSRGRKGAKSKATAQVTPAPAENVEDDTIPRSPDRKAITEVDRELSSTIQEQEQDAVVSVDPGAEDSNHMVPCSAFSPNKGIFENLAEEAPVCSYLSPDRKMSTELYSEEFGTIPEQAQDVMVSKNPGAADSDHSVPCCAPLSSESVREEPAEDAPTCTNLSPDRKASFEVGCDMSGTIQENESDATASINRGTASSDHLGVCIASVIEKNALSESVEDAPIDANITVHSTSGSNGALNTDAPMAENSEDELFVKADDEESSTPHKQGESSPINIIPCAVDSEMPAALSAPSPVKDLFVTESAQVPPVPESRTVTDVDEDDWNTLCKLLESFPVTVTRRTADPRTLAIPNTPSPNECFFVKPLRSSILPSNFKTSMDDKNSGTVIRQRESLPIPVSLYATDPETPAVLSTPSSTGCLFVKPGEFAPIPMESEVEALVMEEEEESNTPHKQIEAFPVTVSPSAAGSEMPAMPSTFSPSKCLPVKSAESILVTHNLAVPPATDSKSPSQIDDCEPSPDQEQTEPKCELLKGAVFYSDVKGSDGRDANDLFIPLLEELGASVVSNWSHDSTSITHVLFRDGHPSSLQKVVASNGAIKAVKISWPIDCQKHNKWLDESDWRYAVGLPPVSTASPPMPRAARRRNTASPTKRSPRKRSPVKIHHDLPESTRTPRARAVSHAGNDFGLTVLRTPSPSLPSSPTECSPLKPSVMQTCPPKQLRKGLFEGAENVLFPLRRRKSVEEGFGVGGPLKRVSMFP